jgi:3-oxosteroid 1-dehydrogenase
MSENVEPRTKLRDRPKNRRRILKNALAAGVGLSLSRYVRRGFSGQAVAEPQTDAYDVIVVGSGAAGMTAALTAAKRGLQVLVIEKASVFGGSTARSGGGIWIRNNEIILEKGVPDSAASAATYLEKVVAGETPKDKQAAFLSHGPSMISFVLNNSPLKFRFMEGYSEYYPELPGGLSNGSSLEPEALDGKILGAELKTLNPPYIPTPPGVVVFGADYKWLNLVAVNARGIAVAAQSVARYVRALFLGQKPLTMGQALAAGLRKGLIDANVPLWLDTPLVDLRVQEDGRVDGVIIQRSGQTVSLTARRAVILGSGGFEHNLEMRRLYQRQPIGIDWTVGAQSNTGDGIQAGERVGATLELMDDAWWGPSLPLPDGPYFCLAERTLPGSILVNGEGLRFVNEGAPYTDVVHTMYDQNKDPKTMPIWLITDQTYRDRYLFKDVLAALPLPEAWFEAGVAFKHKTVEGLAEQIGVPSAALRATITRFNEFARKGRDLDFKRGDSVYDLYYTDPSVGPNSALGELTKAPFYAFKIVPGDLGTKGGLRTDSRSRVLRSDGSVIEGLYAAGNVTASIMGHSYPAAGSTIGPAMTFGYIAGQDIADQSGN